LEWLLVFDKMKMKLREKIEWILLGVGIIAIILGIVGIVLFFV